MTEQDNRLKNYIEYYEKIEPSKRYSLTELMDMDEMELLALMPNNHCVGFNDNDEANKIEYIAGFQMHKVIDDSWHIGYYENNNTKLGKDQQTLFEITYVKDLKIGLIDLFLMIQNRKIEHFNGIKSGRIKIYLGDSWDDRVKLGLETQKN